MLYRAVSHADLLGHMQVPLNQTGADCTFCTIVAGGAPAHVIYDTPLVLAFMDTLPATRGHALIVPKRHRRDLFDAEDEELVALMRAARLVAEAVRSDLAADGVNLVHASGVAAHQTEFHLHLHVVPRYSGDSVIIFPRPGQPEEIAAAADLLRAGLPAVRGNQQKTL